MLGRFVTIDTNSRGRLAHDPYAPFLYYFLLRVCWFDGLHLVLARGRFASIHRAAEKAHSRKLGFRERPNSRKPGFRHTGFSETQGF